MKGERKHLERPTTRTSPAGSSGWLWLAPALLAAGCTDAATRPISPGGGSGVGVGLCTISNSEIFAGTAKDAIPALTDPPTVAAGDPEAGYLLEDDRVIGLTVGDETLAIPLNILWWHEIVNLSIGGRVLAVTHCPLTGSSLVFDRASEGGVEFGVSGLLYRNNLLMYDRRSPESLWPQMSRGARCGPSSGTQLTMYPAMEMTWEGWRSLHPETRVVGSKTGHARDYRVYPYGTYDTPADPTLLFPLNDDIDPRRPPKERVLGVSSSGATIAYPFGALADLGDVGVVSERFHVVFWDGRRDAAMAFHPAIGEQSLTFESDGETIVDLETGTEWGVDGSAVEGPLAGEQLEMISEAYVAFWFAWASFEPFAFLWGA